MLVSNFELLCVNAIGVDRPQYKYEGRRMKKMEKSSLDRVCSVCLKLLVELAVHLTTTTQNLSIVGGM